MGLIPTWNSEIFSIFPSSIAKHISVDWKKVLPSSFGFINTSLTEFEVRTVSYEPLWTNTRLENFKGIFVRVWFNIPTTSDWLEIDKLFIDSTPVEKFVAQVVTWPAATKVFLPMTKGGREESAWECDWKHPGNKSTGKNKDP